MNLVIADAGPINYLILIGHIELLPALFDKIVEYATLFGWIAHSTTC